MKEAIILQGCLRLLRIHPKIAWATRINTGAVKMDGARFLRYGFKGCSDIIGQMVDGRFLAIECKAPKGQLTEFQRAFLNRVLKAHGVAGVARSVADLDEILRAA